MTNIWLSIEQAANLSGKSTTTIRRAVASLTEAEKAQHIKRVQVRGAGGEKILIDRELITSRWQIHKQDAPSIEQDNDTGVLPEWPLERLVSSLEKQVFSLNREVETKNRINEDYSRLASDLTNNVREQTIMNATLQSKILSLGAGSAGGQAQPQAAQHSGGWYWVVVSVTIALIGALLLYLLLVG
jgi:hypothetical protein